MWRDFLIMRKSHGKARPSLGKCAKLVGVLEHLSLRNLCSDDGHAPARESEPLHSSAFTGDTPDNVADVLVWNRHLTGDIGFQ